ncbi:hypothetical protein BB776_02300 [Planococcus salinarum]|uniref:Uncharacterized protein n=1 Tax=Planococcus salinarum TaxID=622695 RepID=A0ABX3D265_9BACL|nr:hypothetical protein [Planococcus salinarum]OHX52465.1 hypothetical protein BB776_02300 [Planococcus salinarum]TAA72014.1 hypothetical protein D2909_08415 [Planococcus salinarum]
MEHENRDEFIIKKYQQDEAVMIQLFVNWAMRNDLDPVQLYQRAYPSQIKNEALLLAVEETESFDMEIGDDTLLELLQMFGNDDLAFVVSEEMERIQRK